MDHVCTDQVECLQLAFGMPGPLELCVIGGVLALIFGPKKLPQLARGIGQSVVELKKGLHEGREMKRQAKADAKRLKEEAQEALTIDVELED